MDTYIVRQPIMNKEQNLEAYEIIYQQDSSVLYNQQDSRVANAMVAFLNHLDTSNFLEGKTAFLTIPPNLLMQNVPRLFDENKLVIQIEESVLTSPEALSILRRYKKQGYKLALLDFDFNKRYLDILPFVDYMKMDFAELSAQDVETRIFLARKYNMETVAYHVDTPELRERAIYYDVSCFQGDSIAEMVRSKVHKVEHLQSNFFRLIAAVSGDNTDFDEIARIISMDVTLSFSLMRVVNSAYFALPNKVKNIKQALTILGLSQLRHWIYLLSFTSEDDGMSETLIKTSFLRATFCQELSSYVKDIQLSKPEIYMMGMFSTLDVLLQVPIKDALADLSIAPEIKAALTGEPGKCSTLLKLCLAYEKGTWEKVGKLAEELGIPIQVIAQKYFESVEYVNDTWNHLTQPFAKREKTEIAGE